MKKQELFTKGGDGMNNDSIRAFCTASGEEEVNALLATGKWRVVEFRYDDDLLVAKLVKVRG